MSLKHAFDRFCVFSHLQTYRDYGARHCLQTPIKGLISMFVVRLQQLPSLFLVCTMDPSCSLNRACPFSRLGSNDMLESWPTSPVLHNEETNAREKEKAHKYYERQLKSCSWYVQPPQRTWIEIVESSDESCSDCYYDDACGCVLASNYGKTTPANETSGRTSRISKNSTEDEKSFYDNLCQFCKITTLERRAKKYGEWRRRFSARLAEIRAQDDGGEQRTCTCAMDKLTFMEWKKLYEQEELIKLSKADHVHRHSRTELRSKSDYGTQMSEVHSDCGTQVSEVHSDCGTHISEIHSDCGTQKSEMHSDYGTQKSKDSTSTAVCRDYTSFTVKRSSLGYDSLSSLPNTETPYAVTDTTDNTSTDASTESEEYWNGCSGFDPHAGRPRMHPALPITRGIPRDEKRGVFSQGNLLKRRDQSKRRKRPQLRTSSSLKTKAQLHEPRRELMNNTEEFRIRESCSEGEVRQTSSEDQDGMILDDAENLAKVPMENDETLPPDILSEFLTIARTIDEFYESIHAKKFRENRVLVTSRDRICSSSEGVSSSRELVNSSHEVINSSRDKVNDVITSSSSTDMTSHESVVDQAGPENFSVELRKRIRSLERLCSFADGDEDGLGTGGSLFEDVKMLGSTPTDEAAVWRLSQHSINLTLSRRSRSGTGTDSGSGRSRQTSTSGSGSSNSRCSTRQSNHKPSTNSVENLKSPDSGFSDSLTRINSTDSCREIGTKWVGSMQWDYSDWEFYYGVPCHEEQIGVSGDHGELRTIDETMPQDPLDWDW